MQTGFGAIREALDAGKTRPTGGGDYSPRLSYISWKAGDTKILRFLDNDPIVAEMHDFISTNDGRTRSFLIDPAKEDYVAKYASPEPGLGWRVDWLTKDLVERKPRKIGIGVAVLRDEVPAGGGHTKVVDAMRDVEVNGKTYSGRTFGVIQQSLRNFWAQLQAFEGRYGTMCDRDYLIERKGDGFDTEYHFIPLDPIDELRDLESLQRFYGYGKPWPQRPEDNATEADKKAWEERFLYCPQTLPQWAEDFSSEDRAKALLLPKDGSTAAAPAPPPAAASSWGSQSDEAQVSSSTDFASLKNRLLESR